MAAVLLRRARPVVLALSWLLGSRLVLAQAMSGIASVDSAGVARAAWSRAAAALGIHDYAAAHREVDHAAAAWPTQPAYLWGRAVAGLLAADTAGVLDALNAYAALGLGRDLRADGRFAGLAIQPGFASVVARLDSNLVPNVRSRVVATLTDSTFWPEGVDYDARSHRYYVASVRHRTIAEVVNGKVARELWPRAMAGMGAVLGVRVDTMRGVLWATLAGIPQMDGYTPGDSIIAAIIRVRIADGVIERRWDLPASPRGHALGDVMLGPAGDVFVTDSYDPVLYRLRAGADTLEAIRHPLFRSLQGMAAPPNANVLYVADYSHGLLRVELGTRAVTRLDDTPSSTSLGCDGLVWYRGAIIAVQNGVAPARIMRYVLDRTGTRIEGAELLDRNTAVADEPTIGTLVGDEFVYVANSQWEKYTERGNNTNGLLLGLFRTPPEFNNKPFLDPVTGLHRSYMVPDANLSTVGVDRIFSNPFFTLYQEVNDQQANRSLGDVNASYVATSWLKFDYTLGADVTNDARLEGCPIDCTGAALGGRITEGRISDYQIDHNLTGTATWHLTNRLGGTFTAGQNLNARNFRTFSDIGRGLIAPQPFSILNTLARDPASDYQYEIHNESYFAQETFDIFDQLYLTAALRNDGSTTFGTQNRRSWFPKASAAWTFTNAHSVPYLTFGKARISYGEAGQEPQPYLTSQTFSGTALTGTISQGTGLTPTQSGNGGLVPTVTKPASALNPERTKELEGGFDIGFLGEKADFSATWYRAQTSDVILITPTPPSSGYSSEAKNAGVFRNSGTELSLNLRPLTRPAYSWDVGIGWARNQSLAVSIAGAEFLPIDNFSGHTENVAMVGRQLGVMRGLGWVRCGITNYADYPALNLAQVCAGAPKGALYIDDGTHCVTKEPDMPCADTRDRIIGDPNPKWTGNLHSTFRYRKLELSGLLDIKKGGDVINGTRGALLSYGTDIETANRATCTTTHNADCTGNLHAFGESNFYPGPVVGPGAGKQIPIGQNWYQASGLAACPFTNMDEPCVEDGGYVKLRELSVAYTFDGAWVGRYLGLSTLDVRVAGRNLKTWTKYRGLDPETNLGGATARSFGGQDYFNLPLTRSFVFTVGLNR